MKTKRKPKQAKTKRFIASMKDMKEAERAGDVTVYSDNLLRACVAVRVGSDWFIVPRCQGGWARRRPLRLSPLAELERLTPARYISAAWLGIPNLL